MLVSGSKLAILLNNLGGTSQLEMNILAGEIRSWLRRFLFFSRCFFLILGLNYVFENTFVLLVKPKLKPFEDTYL